jgi:hypothetical protein
VGWKPNPDSGRPKYLVRSTGTQYAARCAAKLRIQRAYYLTNANCEFAVISKRELLIRKIAEMPDIAGSGVPFAVSSTTEMISFDKDS